MPGIFFGLNLAVFFAGATHNSVANAALIGSLSPFLIVPVGAWLFREYIDPRALVFARRRVRRRGHRAVQRAPQRRRVAGGQRVRRARDAALGGVRRVDAGTSARTWTSPPSWRRSARSRRVAVLPLAIAHGDVFGMSGTGWTYMLILTFTSGVAAQGLMVFAQRDDPDRHDRDRPGGAARARGRVVVPAARRGGESAADRRHRDRRQRAAGVRRAAPARRSSARSSSVMKCEAASMRRSAASHRSRGRAVSPASAAMRASASRAKTSTGASSSRRASSRIATSRVARTRVERRQQALAERGLLPAPGGAVPRGRRLERRPRRRAPSERTQDAPEMHPGERRHADVAGGLGLLDRQLAASRRRSRSHRPGTAHVRG